MKQDNPFMPFKFGQSKKATETRFPSVLVRPSGTRPWSKKPKPNGVNALLEEEKALKR